MMGDFPVRGIFFDLGNVLVGVESEKFSREMTALTGLALEQLRPLFAGRLFLDYECGRLDDDGFLSGLCRATGSSITREALDNIWLGMFRELPLVPDNVLEGLAAQYQLWAISNTNRMHFEFIRERYSFLRYFRGWSLSYEVGAAKPDPAIFTHALAGSGIPASDALFIDDQAVNVDAARGMGFDAIQFLNSSQLIEELRARGLHP